MKGKERMLDKNNMTSMLEKMTMRQVSENQMSRSELSKKKSLQERGITLIALVVTIIILLILAGVTLNMALSQDGLFSKTQEAADKYKQAQEDEELEIEKIEYAVDGKEITEVETISNKEDFDKFKDDVNEGKKNFENTLIKLTEDLDLAGETWTPIGTKEHPFNGSFNGNGHEIKNLSFEVNVDKDYLGLFGYNKGIIKNIGINSSELQFNGTTTAVGAVTGCNEGIIEGCYNKANISSNKINWLGGIVGENKTGGKISKCYNTGKITGSPAEKYKLVGGIMGFGDTNTSVESCYNTGEIKVSTMFHNAMIGGIAGHSRGNIDSCYNTASISLSDDSGKDLGCQAVGGIIGQCNLGVIMRCYNIGNVILSKSENARRDASIVGGIWDPGDVVIEDCWMEDNLNETYKWPGMKEDYKDKEIGKATIITDEIKSNLHKELGENFKEDNGINDGYPILEWQ